MMAGSGPGGRIGAGGSVKPIVERVYPLDEAGEALRHLIEDRQFGNVVLAG
jgi:NADPH:quinone reductase